jgi:magnesium-protoporphyrin IX monomethyl ester (oxidative) cyclase
MTAPNLGLAMIAAVLEQDGIQVKVIDAAAEQLSLDEIINRAREFSPDISGAGGQTAISHFSLEIFRRLKQEVSPNIVTIAGGPHFSFTAEESLQKCPYLDIVVRGEGEYTIREICQRLENTRALNGIAGTTCRNSHGTIVKYPDRPQIADLDSLPFPAWHLFPVKKYHWANINMLGSFTSRGCKYSCPHCITWKIHKGTRRRKPEKIVAELVWVKKNFGVSTFFFHDDTAFTERAHLTGFLDALESCGEKFYWYYEAREDDFLRFRDLWTRMKHNGMFKVALGLDTPNEDIRHYYGRKALKVRETEEMLNYLKHTLGIQISVYLLMGAPWETEQSMQRTLDYAKHLYPRYCSFVMATFVVPYPGTDMFQEMQENNLLTTYDWRDYSFGLPVFKMQVPADRAYQIYKRIWMAVYARPVAFLEIAKNLFSKNKFDRALAKNFLSMPLQMGRLGKIKTIRDVMPDGCGKKSEKPQAASPIDVNTETADTQIEPAPETV